MKCFEADPSLQLFSDERNSQNQCFHIVFEQDNCRTQKAKVFETNREYDAHTAAQPGLVLPVSQPGR